MSYFIIIRGPLGVGKSTIAKRLAQFLDGEYISMDLLLEKYGLDKVEGEECIPLRNFIKADEKILPELRKKLDEGKILVFDGNFYHKEHIGHLIQSLSAAHYVFTLKAPLEICIERDRKRGRKYGEEATRAVHNLVSRFDFGIIIDTNDKTSEEVVKEIVSYLPKPD